MKLTIMENSFNRFGGNIAFKPLEALFYLTPENFGSALCEITLTLRFQCATPFEAQNVNRSLRSSYDNFIELSAKPKRIFKRTKGELQIFTQADFVSVEDFFPKNSDEYKIRNETYFREWNLRVLDILIAEFVTSKPKFKKSDDFNFEACLTWMRSLEAQMPTTKASADSMIELYRKAYEVERSKMSDWELLGEDWSEYHSSARDVVPEAKLWNLSDDFAPNGNDTGADILYFFKDNISRIRKSKDQGSKIFNIQWLSMWGENPPENFDNYDDMKLNDYREFTVGFAFAFLKHLGFCPEWLAEDALKHIRGNEVFAQREHSTWAHLGELKVMNKLMISCLENAPTKKA